MLTHKQGARDERGHTPTTCPLVAEPAATATASQCRASDWITLFAGVSLHHQVLLHSVLVRAAGDTSPHNQPAPHH